jgi:hypothetical protein
MVWHRRLFRREALTPGSHFTAGKLVSSLVKMPRACTRSAVWLLGVALVLSGRAAHADDPKVTCIAAAEHVQQLRDEHKLMQARAEAAKCVREECPDVIKRDCAEAILEIGRAQPSINIRPKMGGTDRADVRVLVDGTQLTTRLDGTPIKLDPGVHVLRLEATGAAPLEQQLIMIEGERTRIIDVALEPASATTARGPLAVTSREEPTAPGARHVPAGAFVLGGVGVLGLVGFTYFGLSARSGIDDLRSSCAPYCTDEQISDVQTKRIAADVSLGIGIVALGIATWLVLRGGESPPRAATTSLARGRF